MVLLLLVFALMLVILLCVWGILDCCAGVSGVGIGGVTVRLIVVVDCGGVFAVRCVVVICVGVVGVVMMCAATCELWR